MRLESDYMHRLVFNRDITVNSYSVINTVYYLLSSIFNSMSTTCVQHVDLLMVARVYTIRFIHKLLENLGSWVQNTIFVHLLSSYCSHIYSQILSRNNFGRQMVFPTIHRAYKDTY